MKNLTITGVYKNIQGLLAFSDCGYSVLVGANGSGKSNWIEAVTAVFLHLIEGRNPGFDYRLSFEGNREIKSIGGAISFFTNETQVGPEGFDFPKKLIVCYSGEDQRLWVKFLRKSIRYMGWISLRLRKRG